MAGNPFYVRPPDLLGATARAAETANYLTQFKDAAGERKIRNALRANYGSSDLSTEQGREAATAKAMQIDPLAAQPYIEAIDRMGRREREKASQLADDVARVMVQVRNLPPEQQAAAYAQAQEMYREALKEPFGPGVVDRHIEEALSLADLLARADKAKTPLSDVGRLSADLQAGRISQKDYAAALRKQTYIAPSGGADAGAWETVDLPGVGKVQRNRRTGKIESMPGQGGGSEWQSGKGPGGIEFRYNARTGETSLARPSGGFYSLDEIRGAIPQGTPLVPRARQPGGGPAFDWGQYKSSSSGGATPAQQANNAEIDAARQYLLNNNVPLSDIANKSQPLGPDGFTPNPDYDPFIATTFRNAMQHKVGDDPQFDAIQQRYRGAQGATGGGTGTNALSGSGTQDDPYTPQSAADLDSLAPGDFYVDPGDGQIYEFVQ